MRKLYQQIIFLFSAEINLSNRQIHDTESKLISSFKDIFNKISIDFESDLRVDSVKKKFKLIISSTDKFISLNVKTIWKLAIGACTFHPDSFTDTNLFIAETYVIIQQINFIIQKKQT